MWFEAHETMARHPKTLKLARLLKVDRRYAVGLLHDLFSWGLTAAEKDGALRGMEAVDIASALDAALLAHSLAMEGKAYAANTGILQDDAGETITCVGHIGKVGMKQTDTEIVKLMIGKE